MKNEILAKWFDRKVNFGDLLAPFLIERLSGKTPVNLMHLPRSFNIFRYKLGNYAHRRALMQRLSLSPEPEYLTVGSVMGWGDWRKDVQVIWGAGFMFPDGALKHRPRRIHAVRGHSTYAMLPSDWRGDIAALGDPGLLVADYFELGPARQNARIGVIAHYKQRAHPVMTALADHPDFKIIEIQQEVASFVEELADCEVVLSSAMHGLIAADSFGIPTRWINFGYLLDGGTFKFRDYYSVFGGGQDDPDPIAGIDDLYAAARKAQSRETAAIKDGLRKSHPF